MTLRVCSPYRGHPAHFLEQPVCEECGSHVVTVDGICTSCGHVSVVSHGACEEALTDPRSPWNDDGRPIYRGNLFGIILLLLVYGGCAASYFLYRGLMR